MKQTEYYHTSEVWPDSSLNLEVEWSISDGQYKPQIEDIWVVYWKPNVTLKTNIKDFPAPFRTWAEDLCIRQAILDLEDIRAGWVSDAD